MGVVEIGDLEDNNSYEWAFPTPKFEVPKYNGTIR
jgi:hypothetical protein